MIKSRDQRFERLGAMKSLLKELKEQIYVWGKESQENK